MAMGATHMARSAYMGCPKGCVKGGNVVVAANTAFIIPSRLFDSQSDEDTGKTGKESRKYKQNALPIFQTRKIGAEKGGDKQD